MVSSVDNDTLLFTPGVRFKLPIESRFSLYGTAGGGFGTFGRAESSVSQTAIFVGTKWTVHGVLDLGGGVDFRLTRLLSLRVDIRDFITGKELGGVQGRNHPIYVFGLAFHY